MVPPTTVTLSDLPVELLIHILSHLDVSDLNNIANTCQYFNHIINDEELWKNLFIKRYNTHHFSSVSRSLKFSQELLERNQRLQKWRKATGIHRTLPLNAPSSEKIIFTYPKVLSFNDQGAIDVLSVEKAKTEASIPVTTPSGCTAYSFSSSASVFGRIDGKIFGKLLASKSYLSSITKFDRQHESAVLSIHNDDANCYSGDEKGSIFVWDLKHGLFLKEYKVSEKPVLLIKGNNELIVACDEKELYVIENGKVRTISHNKNIRSLDVDFGGKIIVVTDLTSVAMYSFDISTFGRYHHLELNSQIQCLSLEHKGFNNRDSRIAGYDGCNLGIVTKLGEVCIINIRDVKVNATNEVSPKVRIFPVLDNLLKPEGWPVISSIAVNSSVVLLGSYNGYAGVYDILTGEFIRMVSSRIPKRYLLLTDDDYLIPVKAVELGERNETHGVLLVNNVIQYFQFGVLASKVEKKKSKKKLAGVLNERRDKMKKKIRHEIDEMNHEEFEHYKSQELLSKYNGNELTEEEQIQVAMVLNRSLQDKHKPQTVGKENEDRHDDIDEDLAKALELSKLEADSSSSHHATNGGSSKSLETSSHDAVYDHDLAKALELSRFDEDIESPTDGPSHIPELTKESNDNTDADFEKQLKEAMRRSLYE